MINKAIKYMRKQNNLTQKELGDLLLMNRTTLGNYETNTSQPTFDIIENIANKCGYKILFTNDKEQFELKDLERKDI